MQYGYFPGTLRYKGMEVLGQGADTCLAVCPEKF